MAITSLGGSVIQPKKPYSAILSTSAATSTYVTLLNVTSGRGCVSKIVFGSFFSSWISNYQLNLRITVDGTQYTITNFTTNTSAQNALRGTERGNSLSTGATPNSGANFEYLQQVYFNTSILIEMNQTSGSTCNIFAMCDYALT